MQAVTAILGWHFAIQTLAPLVAKVAKLVSIDSMPQTKIEFSIASEIALVEQLRSLS